MPAVPATTAEGGTWSFASVRREIATNTEHSENQNAMAMNRSAQPAEVPATMYASFFRTDIDVVLIHYE